MSDSRIMRGSQRDTGLLWASGLVTFGGIMLLTMGFLQFLQGLSAVFKDQLYVAGPKYLYRFDLTAWGWAHVIVGVIAIVIGVTLLLGKSFGLYAGLAIAGLSALTNFTFLPYYPLWAIVLIAFDVAIIWAISVLLGQRW